MSKSGVALWEWSQKEGDFDKNIWYFRKNKEFLSKEYNILHHFLVIWVPQAPKTAISTHSYYSLSLNPPLNIRLSDRNFILSVLGRRETYLLIT